MINRILVFISLSAIFVMVAFFLYIVLSVGYVFIVESPSGGDEIYAKLVELHGVDSIVDFQMVKGEASFSMAVGGGGTVDFFRVSESDLISASGFDIVSMGDLRFDCKIRHYGRDFSTSMMRVSVLNNLIQDVEEVTKVSDVVTDYELYYDFFERNRVLSTTCPVEPDERLHYHCWTCAVVNKEEMTPKN
jgi:hypothetical protein